MQEPESRWATNQDVEIHYLDTRAKADRSLTPVVFVPGALGAAENYGEEMAALAPRRCIAISLRGRGQSDAPIDGYGFVDHVRDIEAVIDDSGVTDFVLAGYSMGVAYALGYAILHPTHLTGMIIGDYPAHYPHLKPEWAETAIKNMPGKAPVYAVQGIRSESAEIQLWDDLESIEAPVLLLRGDQPGSLLSAEDATKYIASLPQAMAVVFPGSGHELWVPSKERYLGTVKAFLEGIDLSLRVDEDIV
jgi:pimeloyl-ACP methyl ester carboxylesterase